MPILLNHSSRFANFQPKLRNTSHGIIQGVPDALAKGSQNL